MFCVNRKHHKAQQIWIPLHGTTKSCFGGYSFACFSKFHTCIWIFFFKLIHTPSQKSCFLCTCEQKNRNKDKTVGKGKGLLLIQVSFIPPASKVYRCVLFWRELSRKKPKLWVPDEKRAEIHGCNAGLMHYFCWILQKDLQYLKSGKFFDNFVCPFSVSVGSGSF